MYLLFNTLFTSLVIFLVIGVITVIVFAKKEKPIKLPKIKINKKKDKKWIL